jgi:microcystin-dependent protein
VSIYDDRPVQDTLDGLWTGTIAKGASGVSDTVEVIIKQFDPDLRWGPCKWQPNGGQLPQRGEECLVSFSEEQRPYVVAWWSAQAPPTIPPPTPAGAIMQFAGSASPTGWLLCDGTSYPVASYSALHSAIGYTYGGSGANFNVPNLKGRVPVGRDAAQTEFDVLGETGGAKTHTLAATEMPSHNHTQSAHSHAELYFANQIMALNVGGNERSVHGNSGPAYGHLSSEAPAIQNAGGGQAHNNLQPYIAVNYIIKA